MTAGLRTLIAAIEMLSGWRRAGVAFIAGAGAATAQAPFYLAPLMAAGFSTLILLIDGARDSEKPFRRGFWAGWFFGFGYFLVSLFWVGFA